MHNNILTREQKVEGIGTACKLFGYFKGLDFDKAAEVIMEMGDEDEITVDEAEWYLRSIGFEDQGITVEKVA